VESLPLGNSARNQPSKNSTSVDSGYYAPLPPPPEPEVLLPRSATMSETMSSFPGRTLSTQGLGLNNSFRNEVPNSNSFRDNRVPSSNNYNNNAGIPASNSFRDNRVPSINSFHNVVGANSYRTISDGRALLVDVGNHMHRTISDITR